MTWTPITGAPTKYSVDDTDYWLKFYKAGTVTPISVAINANGDSPLAKVKINPNGYPISNPLDDTTVFIPHIDQDYRIVLYLSETDADNNNTANADFNVDGVIQNIAPSGTATDVSLRQTTLLVQDDYDRSPLFVDGEDFTAGAGPHVITVPAGWTPSGTDTRFYKKDASGIITNLTPTDKDSTTFTLAETLLSTDEVFIGDDTFRNQIDGDPKAIRERLSVSTTSESDARYLLESNNLSDLVSDATARTNLDVYSKSEADSAFLEDSAGSVLESNLASQSVTNSKLGSEAVEPQNLKTVKYELTVSVPSAGKSFDTGIAVSTFELPLIVYSDDENIRCTLAKDGVGVDTWRIQTENVSGGALTRTLTFIRLVV